MLTKKFSVAKFAMILIMAVLGVVLLAKAVVLALAPSLHVDESYYIGAARRILAGDLLLTTFVFDKLFLQPFVVAFGILFLGSTVLGFRIAGVLFMLATFVVFKRLIAAFVSRVSEKPPSFSTAFLSASLAFVFLAMPLVLQHEAAAMTEPALIFFLALAGLRAVASEKSMEWAVPWTLAAFAKMSAVMWLPFFVLIELIVRRENPASILRVFWFKTRWYWAAAVLFQAFNRKKFAAFSWFSHLGQNQKQKTALLERVGFWFETLNAQTYWLGSFALLASIATLLFIFRGRKPLTECSRSEKWTLVVCLGALAHMAGVPLSGAPLYERYLITLFPLLILAVVAILVFTLSSRDSSKAWWTGLQSALAVLVISVGICFVLLNQSPIEPSRERGRVLEIASQVIPETASLASPLLWELYPYESSSWVRSMCDEPSCLWANRAGLTDNLGYSISASGNQISVKRAPFVLSEIGKATCKNEETIFDQVALKDSLRSALLAEMRIKNPESLSDLRVFGGVANDDLTTGLTAEFNVSDPRFAFVVKGYFQLLPSFDLKKNISDPGLVFVVKSINVVRPVVFDGTDVLPIIWKKRVFRIARFDLSSVNKAASYHLSDVNIAENTVRLSMQNCR